MSDASVPMAGVGLPTAEIGVAAPAELTELASRAREPATLRVIHMDYLRGPVAVDIPLSPVTVEVGRGVFIGGASVTMEMVAEQYKEAAAKAGLKVPK